MSETDAKMCRICLTTSRDDNICDSTCFVELFIQIMSLKDFNEQLWLCMWCRASLKRVTALLTLAIESDKALQYESTKNILNNSKSLYTLNYTHNPHIDIAPLTECKEDSKDEIVTKNSKEIIITKHEIQNEIEIPLTRNENELKCIEMKLTDNINEESNEILNFEHDILLDNETETAKRKKNELIFYELKFEVEHLNLEEQLKEVEMKKVKYKDFNFQCNECGLGFHTNDVFEEHKIRHTELTGPYKCNICSLHFKSQDVLSQHILAHKRRFKCLLCGAIFQRSTHCTAHRYKCGGINEPIACGVCSKIFSNEHSLKIHMKVHKSEKKYCCDQCDKKFANKHRLTVHLRSHSGIKPFSCTRCHRSFSIRSNLRAHSSVHFETTPFYCVECNSYYKTAKSLKRHFNESARHATSKNYGFSCKDCSKQFSTEKALNYHIKSRHDTEHRCTQCDKTFSNNSNLNKHIKCIHTAK